MRSTSSGVSFATARAVSAGSCSDEGTAQELGGAVPRVVAQTSTAQVPDPSAIADRNVSMALIDDGEKALPLEVTVAALEQLGRDLAIGPLPALRPLAP